MSTFHKRIVLGCAAIGLSVAALTGAIAQTPNAPPAGQRSEQWQQKRMEHMQKRQAAMHDALKLTATQESAWKTYVDKTKPNDAMVRMNREEMAKLSAPERIERRLAKSKERDARMSTRLAAMKEFYAVLTPEQQKIMNEQSMHQRGGRGHHGGGHHMMPAAK